MSFWERYKADVVRDALIVKLARETGILPRVWKRAILVDQRQGQFCVVIRVARGQRVPGGLPRELHALPLVYETHESPDAIVFEARKPS